MTQVPVDDEKFSPIKVEHDENCDHLSKIETAVDGTTQLYDDGQLNYIPMPTASPKDPLNLPQWRKILILVSLCFYGAMSLATQQIVGSLIPVFVFVYAGLDPNLLTSGGGSPPGGSGAPGGGSSSKVAMTSDASPTVEPISTRDAISNFVPRSILNGYIYPGGITSSLEKRADGNSAAALEAILANSPGAPTLQQINMLSSIPVLVVGLSNYILVPVSVAIGRRPVLIFCGILAWVCAIWAGFSTSLTSHLVARSFQAIGAGAVESLIPYIAQDISFIHERSRSIGIIWASQGIVTLALGVSSTYLVQNLGWRWLYFVLSIITAIAWIMCVLFVPETRWQRTSDEMRGVSTHLPPGVQRPVLDPAKFGARTLKDDLALQSGGIRWKDAKLSMLEIVESLLFPSVVWIVLTNAVFIGVSLASSMTMSSVLLAPPYSWSFQYVGLSTIPIVISAVFVYVIGSWGADKMSNSVTKRQGGRREAEVHLTNLIFPLFCGILGCILFGVGGEYVYSVHWTAILVGAALLNFSFLTINIVGSVYCVESYPKWAGPVLVNVASFRNIIGFAFTFGVADWVQVRGYMGCFGIFAGCIAVLAIPLPFMWKYGKAMRKKTGVLTKITTHSI
ncbi:hypothetical protein VE03_06877 [Pseudogymnoascus sp. 23342-1-I1]|nr:hypothetical protein VE03_06877 [Pseudogymnoascus sp. 23342-1-I1]